MAQADYYRILSQGEINTQCVEEEGQVVMVTEHRTTDGGNRQGHVVIKVFNVLLFCKLAHVLLIVTVCILFYQLHYRSPKFGHGL